MYVIGYAFLGVTVLEHPNSHNNRQDEFSSSEFAKRIFDLVVKKGSIKNYSQRKQLLS